MSRADTAAGGETEIRHGLLRRTARALRSRFRAGVTTTALATRRAADRVRARASELMETFAVHAGSRLVRSGTDLLLYPHRSEEVALPVPLAVGDRIFDVVADLEAYTGLTGDQVRMLVARRIESFRSEWQGWPRELRVDDWYYRASRLYLFANASHVHDTPELIALIADAAPRQHRVLEFGGGTGNLTLALAALGFDVDYVDLSALQKDFVRYRASRYGLSERIRVLDSWQGLPRGAYGAVCALDVLEHLPNLRTVLEDQLLPSLSAGGVLVEQSPFVQSVSNPMHHLDDAGMDAILHAHGLRVIAEHRLCRIWKRDAAAGTNSATSVR